MSIGLFTERIQCPYCWEEIEVLIDDCGENQQYIEDCQVCCQPINFQIDIDEFEQRHVSVWADNGEY